MVMITGNQVEREPGRFTPDLMISPTANRNHPLQAIPRHCQRIGKEVLSEYRIVTDCGSSKTI
ncbi:hypothetical protein ANCCAN_13752 [Ancylostoma caninum]|uniref:Uncharacterized protein n=1 Tax=Ancylostoma caninum TaxID=29170 RepID=A0A368GBY6_ANCCA|nr:hypothetical protein ANCCAN_13752 [Ancylostoma caninum]